MSSQNDRGRCCAFFRRRLSCCLHPTMDPRVREDDVEGESGASEPGTARASHPVIPATPPSFPCPPSVIPASPPSFPLSPPSFPRRRESILTFSGHRAQRCDAFPGLHPTMDPRVRKDDICRKGRCPSGVPAGLDTHWQEGSPGNEGLQRAFAAGPPLPRGGGFKRAIRGVLEPVGAAAPPRISQRAPGSLMPTLTQPSTLEANTTTIRPAEPFSDLHPGQVQ